jgi:enamine deaminase RidA (YjgF/YER057c/UK114 family)
MIVHSPVDTPGTGVTHEWLPWLMNSPVYCRLSRVHGHSQIFVSGCFGTSGDSESLQVAEVFDQLQERLTAAGSDLRHMVKATYYVTNEAASAAVNEIRPKLWDPDILPRRQRPS